MLGSFGATITANLDATYSSEGFENGFTWIHSVAYSQIDNVFPDDNGNPVTDNFRIQPVLTINEFTCAGKNYFKLQVVQTGYKNVINGAGGIVKSSGERSEHDSYGKISNPLASEFE